jgi:hypothetical protein
MVITSWVHVILILIESNVLLATCECRSALPADTLEICACTIISMPLMQGSDLTHKAFSLSDISYSDSWNSITEP